MSTKIIELLDLEAHHDEDEMRPPIAVPTGEIVIGREPFLQCIDPGVSRSHAKLKASDDGKLIFISIHKKPSYYQRKGDNDKTILKTSEEVELNDGDTFFLSATSHGYKVKISDYIIPEENETKLENIPTVETGSSNVKNQGLNDDKVNTLQPREKRAFPKWMLDDENAEEAVDSKSSPKKSDDDKEKVLAISTPKKKSRSPRKKLPVATALHDVSESDEDTEPIAKKRVTGKLKTQHLASTSTAHELSDMEDESADKGSEKRSVNQENASGGQDNGVSISDVAQILGVILSQEQAGREAAEDGDNEEEPDEDDDKNNASTSNTQPRTPCIYADRCYRKNLQHRADFSHPGDPDFADPAARAASPTKGPGSPKPRCAYGTSCYRRNPQHIADFNHTQPPISPPSSPARAKRARKAKAKKRSPKKKQGSWNDSSGSEESYEDSFIDDSSDVYSPGATTEDDD